MNVLLLSPYGMNLARTIKRHGDHVFTSDIVPWGGCEMAVMFGHRKILKLADLEAYPKRVINLHTSLLPWNRGASPNFWSWFDDTPKGISFHFVDEGIDTGEIIASEQVMFHEQSETLRTSYNALHEAAEALFDRMWPVIRQGTTGLRQDPSQGSYHSKRDLERIWPCLSKGWDSPVTEIMQLGVEARHDKSLLAS